MAKLTAKHVSSFLVLSLVLISLTRSAAAAAEPNNSNTDHGTDNRAVDCALLHGTLVAATVLAVGNDSRTMNVDGWLSKFENNVERHRALSVGLTFIMSKTYSEVVLSTLRSIKNSLDSTVSSGQGNVYYWRDLVHQQHLTYISVHESLTDLRNQVCTPVE